MMKKIVILGSFIVDLTSRVPCFPKPGETVLGNSFRMGAGGKGSNQAIAAHRAGASVAFVTKLGNDILGNIALDLYRRENISTEHILFDEKTETGTALILVDQADGQNMIVVNLGACGKISIDDVLSIKPVIEQADYLLMQLEIPLLAVTAAAQIAKGCGTKVILNPAPAQKLPDELLSVIDYITPNEAEAEFLTGVVVQTEEDARIAAKKLLSSGAKNVMITLGDKGILFMDDVMERIIPGIRVDVADTTGAGDAFNGAFVAALANGFDVLDAAQFGNTAGALSVTKEGAAAAMPSYGDIMKLFHKTYKP